MQGIALALLLGAVAAEGIALQFGWTPIDLGDLYRRNPKLSLTAVAALGILAFWASKRADRRQEPRTAAIHI
jgi:hypothetical protein